MILKKKVLWIFFFNIIFFVFHEDTIALFFSR